MGMVGKSKLNLACALLFCITLAASCSEPPVKGGVTPRSSNALMAKAPESVGTPADSPEGKTDKAESEEDEKDEAITKASPTPTPDPENLVGGIQIVPDVDLRSWKILSDEDGIQGYQKHLEENDEVSFRGEAIFPASILKIAAALNDDNLRKEWIDAYGESHQISQVSPLERIEYQRVKVPWPFQDRDFVYHAQVKIAEHPRTMWIAMKSVIDPREPPHEGSVRGKIIYSYYYLKELVPGKSTKVVIEMAVDPEGKIPKWLVNLDQRKWPHNTIKSLMAITERENLVVPAFVENYFKQEGLKTASSKKRKKGNR